jgi:hypothetical protein
MNLQIRFFSNETKPVYLGTDRNLLPNRACIQKEQIRQKQICQAVQGDVVKVRDTLLKDQFPSLSNEEEYSRCIGVRFYSCRPGFEGYAKETRKLNCIKDTIKEMNGRPKTTVCINVRTTGGLRRVISIAYRGPGVVTSMNNVLISTRECRHTIDRRK